MDDATLQKTLLAAFDSAMSGVNITSAMKDSLKTTLLPVITSEITSIFSEKLIADLHSGDSKTILNALTLLTAVDTDPTLTPEDRTVIHDYLKAMTEVLAFLAQIRATIASLEGSTTQELAKTKLDQISGQVQNAAELLKNQFAKIEQTYADNVAAIEKANTMKWVMPLVTLLVAVVMLIVIVAAIVFTCVTAGAGAPTIVAAGSLAGTLISMCVALAVTAATVIVAAVDLGMSASSTHTGLWDSLWTACGVSKEDTVTRAFLTTMVQVLADVIIIVATLGIGVAIVGAASGVNIAATVAKEAITATFKVSTLVGQTVVGSIISAAMSGGLLTILLQKLGNVMFKDDEKSSMIFAIVATVILMIIMALLAAKFCASGASSAAGSAAKAGTTAAAAGQTAGQATQITVGAVARTIASSLVRLLKSLNGAWDESLEIAKMGLKDCLTVILDLIKQIGRNVASRIVTSLKEAAEATASKIKGIPGDIRSNLDAVYKSALKALKDLYQLFRPVAKLPPGFIGPQLPTFVERLQLFIKNYGQLFLGMGIEGIKLGTTGAQIAIAAEQYKAAKVREEFEKDMAGLETIIASLDALIAMIENMKGSDATAVISDNSTGARDQTERWNALVQLVESMINSASAEANKLVSV
jgi:hypothetical protein